MDTLQKQWLTPDDLQEEFAFSKSRQAKLRMERKIPFSKIGSYVRYSRDEINRRLEDAKVA